MKIISRDGERRGNPLLTDDESASLLHSRRESHVMLQATEHIAIIDAGNQTIKVKNATKINPGLHGTARGSKRTYGDAARAILLQRPLEKNVFTQTFLSCSRSYQSKSRVRYMMAASAANRPTLPMSRA